ncbi:MAG: type VI secretion system protein TssA [Pyrinomonadaceae bacterium]
MTNIESKPSVIDFEALLQPISEESPSGESLRFSNIYDEIKEARRADEELPQGEWQTELKTADFRKVIALATSALESNTKDLQIAAWLSEALVKQHGFTGLRDGLKLVSGLQDKFWETLHPEIDEGDMEGRANAVAWMDAQAALAVKGAAITGEGYSFADFEDSKRYDIPEGIDTLDTADQEKYRELAAEAEAKNKVTADKWRKSKASTRRAFYEELTVAIAECWTEYAEINRVIEEKYDRNQAPGLNNLKKALDDIQTQVKRLLEEKRAEEPDEADESADEAQATEGGDGTAGGGAVAVAGSGGAIRTRQDALKRLGELAEYFRKNEPQSPVSYLISRAVKWGNMPFENWLQDVIKDETVLYQLRQTLGLNTGLQSDSEGYESPE